ncbi:MAG: hypothetical protein ICV60_20440 [Pyrinomonadaceae bacterium]|nr:hypothetical protein [Pyrinomonadaceae bacterium]
MIGKAFGVGLLWLAIGLSSALAQSYSQRDQDYYRGRGESSAWGTDAAVRQRSGGGSLGVKRVRIERRAGYDRLVFEFDAGAPNYWVHYEDPPIQLYSGEVVKVRGKAFIEVSLSPILYSKKNYNTPVVRLKRGRTPLRTTLVSDVWSMGWFEGEMIYAVGLNARRPFRVRMLSNPARLVIDFKK